MRIGIIDQNRALLQSLTVLLEAKGHCVLGFDELETALATFRTDGFPDLLIADLLVPGTPPRTVGIHLRACIPDRCALVLTSSRTDAVEPLDLEAIGATAFLPKPFDLDHLSRLVGEVWE